SAETRPERTGAARRTGAGATGCTQPVRTTSWGGHVPLLAYKQCEAYGTVGSLRTASKQAAERGMRCHQSPSTVGDSLPGITFGRVNVKSPRHTGCLLHPTRCTEAPNVSTGTPAHARSHAPGRAAAHIVPRGVDRCDTTTAPGPVLRPLAAAARA